MKILIFGNNYQREALNGIKTLIDHLALRGIECSIESEFHDYLTGELGSLSTVGAFDCECIDSETNLAISLGGDGTFLTTVMWVAHLGIPILGVNTGHLGYLTACSLDQACDMIDDFVAGRHQLQQRNMIQVHCPDVDIKHPFALNEVAILRHDSSSMIEMETSLDEHPLTTYKGDGIVISTPTGSTAYNLSAGGPILAPSTACLVITPVSPHSLTMRPLVVPDNAHITVTTQARSDFYLLSLDGESFTCPAGSTVTITRSPIKVMVVQRAGHYFSSTLQQKLHWGV